MGYSVQDSYGKWWDAPPQQTLATQPGESGTLQLQWQPPETAPRGVYNATVALWEGYNKTNNLMEGEFDRRTKNNAFQLMPIQAGGQSRTSGQKATSHIITVGPLASDYSSIQAAIEAANPGSVILIQNGTYHENVNVTKPLIIRGAEIKDKMPVLDGNGEKSAITLSVDGITIQDLAAMNSGIGIEVDSKENSLVGNLLQKNRCGIYIKMPNNTVKFNEILNNFVGITVDHAGSNILEANSIQGNAFRGIYLKDSGDYNKITDNNIIGNFQGIYYERSRNNMLVGNMVKNNSKIGAYLANSSANLIYKNIFINNSQDAYDDGKNIWHSGTLGNYYSNYPCTAHSPNGTCDSIYNIPGEIISISTP